MNDAFVIHEKWNYGVGLFGIDNTVKLVRHYEYRFETSVLNASEITFDVYENGMVKCHIRTMCQGIYNNPFEQFTIHITDGGKMEDRFMDRIDFFFKPLLEENLPGSVGIARFMCRNYFHPYEWIGFQPKLLPYVLDNLHFLKLQYKAEQDKWNQLKHSYEHRIQQVTLANTAQYIDEDVQRSIEEITSTLFDLLHDSDPDLTTVNYQEVDDLVDLTFGASK